MRDAVTVSLVVLIPYVVLYLIVVLMPRWYVAVAVAAVLGGMVWYRLRAAEEYVRSHSDADWVLFDIGIYQVILQVLAAALTVKLIAAAFRGGGFTRRVMIPLHVAGFLALPTFYSIPPAWQAWVNRSPAEACLKSSFKVDIVRGGFRVPAAPIFSVHLSPDATDGNYFFSHAPLLRHLCAKTDNGSVALRANALAIWFERTRCSSGPLWVRSQCAEFVSKHDALLAQSDWPIRATIFDPDGIRHGGGFNATRSTYEDSFKPVTRKEEHYFISSTLITPDGKPLAAVCYPANASTQYCRTSYPWRDGMHIVFDFHAPNDAIEDAVRRKDARLRALLEGLLLPSGG